MPPDRRGPNVPLDGKRITFFYILGTTDISEAGLFALYVEVRICYQIH